MATNSFSDPLSSGRRVRTISPSIVEEFFLAKGAQLLSGSARACFPRHQGSRRCEAAGRAEDKRDEEVGDEVNGEVEEIRRDAQHTHETWR